MVQHRRARLAATVVLGVGGVVGAALTMPSFGSTAPSTSPVARTHDKVATTEVAAARLRDEAAADQKKYGKVSGFLRRESGRDGVEGHTHNDPATKNAISRSEESTSKAAADPTTEQQAARARAAARAMRAEAKPQVVPTDLRGPRYLHPRTRYEMASGCYAFQAVTNAKWLKRTADGVAATAGTSGSAAPLRFHATALGSYLLYGTAKDLLDGASGAVSWGSTPGATGDWTVRRNRAGRFSFKVADGFLTTAKNGAVTLSSTDQGAASRFELTRVGGCASFPDIAINITGGPYAGVSSFQQTYGTVDAHTHGMAFEFLGGALHCGKPWDRYGVTVALKDCPDHESTGGYGAVVEDFLSGNNPGTGHDPVGWPTFKDWPAPHSLTHEGTYYRWMERAWRGGLRLFTNLLVENNKLCQLYPLKSQKVATQNPTCDDMKTLAFEKDDMYALQDYVDAQYGGPGKGWYRIVKDPFEARRVINSGRLAIVMGIETSIPFECSVTPNPVPGGDPVPAPPAGSAPGTTCDAASVDQWLDTVHKWGVRQMEVVNKFDNAFSGIAGDAGTTGVLVNSANLLETGSAWRMKHCDGTEPSMPELTDEVHDNDQIENPSSIPGSEQFPAEQQDALFGAVLEVAGMAPLALPVYENPHHCNSYGLSSLGEHLITSMASRGMLFDPDHMSVKARKKSLDVVEALNYPGVLSSHSWSTPDAYPRILKLGGFVAPYAGDSKGFVDKWERLQTWTDPRYFFGVGYGADINGLGAQGDARNPTGADKVTYPFTGFGGVTVGKQHSGQRVYDINSDGVAHYGLYPDWLQDLEVQAGQDITDDMGRGSEAYLQTWERAVGVSNDACRQPSVRKAVSVFKNLSLGATVRTVLLTAGQPHTRLGTSFGYCAKRGDGSTARLTLTFSKAGRLQKVS